MLDDADLEQVITSDVQAMYVHSGQSCNAGSRMLVPRPEMGQAGAIARAATEQVRVGAPEDERTAVGRVVSETQFDKIQGSLQKGIEEGATVVVGGPGRPEGIDKGFYLKPTVFADVDNSMTIAREEIFGPVLTLIGYEDEDEAVRIANDTRYGLSGKASSADKERASKVARRLRTGTVHLNGAPLAFDAPFGGDKQSGNGRVYGAHGLLELLETTSIYGDTEMS